MEDNLIKGDNLVKQANETFEKIKALVCDKSKWDKIRYSFCIGMGSHFNHSGITGEELKNLFQYCKINANHLFLKLIPPPNYIPEFDKGANYWKLSLTITLSEGMYDIPISKLKDYIFAQDVCVYVPHTGKSKIINNVIKDYIKPAFKDIKSFTKFINDIISNQNNILE